LSHVIGCANYDTLLCRNALYVNTGYVMHCTSTQVTFIYKLVTS